MDNDYNPKPNAKQEVQDSFNNSMFLPRLKKAFSNDSLKEALQRKKNQLQSMKLDVADGG